MAPVHRRRSGAFGVATATIFLVLALAVPGMAYPGEDDPDAELVRFTVTGVSARALPTVDVDENDPYCVGSAEGAEVWRLPTQQEVGRDVAWPGEMRSFDLPQPLLDHAPGSHVLTVQFFDEDEDGDDEAGTTTIDLVALPFGETTITDQALIDPEPGLVSLTIRKEIVEKTLLVTEPTAEALEDPLPAGTTVDVAWDTDGLISTVILKLYSSDMGEIDLSAVQPNVGGDLVVLPHWLEDGSDYEIRVYDAKSLPNPADDGEDDGEGDGEGETPRDVIVGASIVFAVEGATLDLDEIPHAELVLGVPSTIAWQVTGLVTDIEVSLRRGGTPGEADGTVVSVLSSETAGSGGFPFTPALDVVPGSDYRIEVTGTVEGMRAMSTSSGFIAVKAIAVRLPRLATPIPHASGTSLSTEEDVVIEYVVGQHVSNMKIVLQHGGVDHLVLASEAPTPEDNPGQFFWTVPADISPLEESYTVHLADAEDDLYFGDSDAFDINGPSVTLLPVEDDADMLLLGTNYQLSWVARGRVETVNVELLLNGQPALTIAAGVAARTGTLLWSTGVELPMPQADGIQLDESGASGGNGPATAPPRPPAGEFGNYFIRVADASPDADMSDVSSAFSLAYAADAPNFPGSTPLTMGEMIELPVRARPESNEAFVFASLVENTGEGPIGTWPEVVAIGVIPLPPPEEPHAPVTASIEWQVPVSKQLVELGSRGENALVLRLLLLDGDEVYDASSAPLGLLVPLRYDTGEWSECSAECDGGTRTRSLTCNEVSDFGDVEGTEVTFSRCALLLLDMPSISEQCNTAPCSGHTWNTGAWGECSAFCGEGERSRPVFCVGISNGDTVTVDDAECDAAGLAGEQPSATESCFLMPCEVFQWTPRAWTECTQACGGGMRYRSVECVGNYGTIAASGSSDGPCATLARPAASESCNVEECPLFMWESSEWTPCTARCGGGTSDRDVHCIETANSEVVDASNCDADAQLASERVCNTVVCRVDSRFWETTSFGECSEACGGGVQTRTVLCVDADGSERDASECEPETSGAGAQPPSEAACNTHACDVCASGPCGDHGTCSSEFDATVCECEDGFQGAFCATPDTCDGDVDASNECCAGVMMAGGECCGTNLSARVDSTGACCESGIVDACGVCDGDSVQLSVTGECCGPDAVPELDGAGLCCYSGHVDVCGVCGGDGTSCSVVAQITVEVPEGTDAAAVLVPNSPERLEFEVDTFPSLIAPLLGVDASLVTVVDVQASSVGDNLLVVSFSVLPSGDADSTSAGVLLARVNEAAADNDFVTSVQSISTDGVCGNNLCEYGEVCSLAVSDATACCPSDCPITLHVCPTPEGTNQQCGGELRGQCIISTGTCNCWPGAGYTGEDCGSCESGFAMSAELKCEPVFEVSRGFGSLDSAMPDWALAVIVIVAVFGFGGIVYCVCRSQGRCGGGKPSGGDLPQFSGAVAGRSISYT
mmetsp:Transcript_85484/g.207188  ORF Transcript_85484/g.207188 Transcript_85484/m.207188 type:complete len:1463 (+) Transcript_85484:100-4488(+)